MSDQPSKAARLKEAARHSTVLDDTASTGARAYAEALVNLAEKAGKAEAVLEDLEAVQTEVLAAHPELAAVLASPSLGVAKKDRIITRVLDGRADELSVKFLRLLNRNGRLVLLGSILRQAREFRDKRLNRRAVVVRSAVELDPGQRQELIEKLRSGLGSEPVVKFEVEPALLGGLVVRLGDQVHDASLRAQLRRMRQRLVVERVREVRGALSGAMTVES